MAAKTKGPAHIAEPLWPLVVPLDTLQLHPRNPNQGDVGAITESLSEFTQLKPVVAQQRDGEPHVIVAGNHTYMAAAALGWSGLAAVVVPMDDRKALRFATADNRTAQLGTMDEAVLVDILTELALAGDLAGTGYDAEDVDDLVKLMQDPSDLLELQQKYGDDVPADHFWPVIKVKVSPKTEARWKALWATTSEGSDDERMQQLLKRVGPA